MQSNSSSDESEPDLSLAKTKKRKGVVNSELCKRNVIEKARIMGTEYTNYAGNPVAARTTGKDCKCKLKCFTKFKDVDFINILNGFSSHKDKDGKDIFLQSLID